MAVSQAYRSIGNKSLDCVLERVERRFTDYYLGGFTGGSWYSIELRSSFFGFDTDYVITILHNIGTPIKEITAKWL